MIISDVPECSQTFSDDHEQQTFENRVLATRYAENYFSTAAGRIS
jgi:hypothetical protein